MERTYIAIDLKSFYASVECVERGLDPLVTNLVVADSTRTDKTICLAVSPGLKSYGVPGRPRLFEVKQAVNNINKARLSKAPGKTFTGKSEFTDKLAQDPSLELDFVCAVPRMNLYMTYSTNIVSIYLRYIAPEDIHIYSCDEVFMDVTGYLRTYKMTAHELALKMVREVLSETGITATAGIGSNMYLCKIAMDIMAKKMPADKDGVRIAELTERSYREQLWDHRPLTSFWGLGPGTARRLERLGLFTMGDVAKFSESCEDTLYREFGVKAEILIDHAWGWEPCTIEEIKNYKPTTNSISSGQVLMRPYAYDEAAIIVREMTDLLAVDLVKKGVKTDRLTLTLGYESFADAKEAASFKGEISVDRYGRLTPKYAHGTANLHGYSDSLTKIVDSVMKLYDEITDEKLMVRRVTIAACNLLRREDVPEESEVHQLSLFEDFETESEQKKKDEEREEKERALALAEINIKKRYGKNAIIKGTNLLEGATTIERNNQVGGHKA
jgi:DNA polymerase V